MRHAFGDHIARFATLDVAKEMLGHESVATTQRYTGRPSMDQIAEAVKGFGFGYGELSEEDRPADPLQVADQTFRR